MENTGKLCDIVIPVLDNLDMTKRCLEAIYRFTGSPFRLILIDNHSGNETKQYLLDFGRTHSNCTLLRNDENCGWIKAVNQGIRAAKGRYICIMNNDAIVKTDGWLEKMIDVADEDLHIGLVNPAFDIKKTGSSGNTYIEVDFCRGYCMLIKKSVVEKIGCLDEAYGLGYYDDDDYSVRAIRAGFRCVRANGVYVEHLRDSTFSVLFSDPKRRALHEKNKNLFYSKWGRRLRVAFILTGDTAWEAVSEALFSLARRQHVVYLWSALRNAGRKHINIRERCIPPYFSGLYFYLLLRVNRFKRKPKRYDLVFVDSERMSYLLSGAGCVTFFVDPEKDIDTIANIADSVSKA